MAEQYVEVNLPYFKQGDDLGWALENSTTAQEAFLKHAEMLREAADKLTTIAKYLEEVEKENVYADTHHIGMTLPDDLATLLIDKELVEPDPWDGEDEWEEEEDDDDLDEENETE